MGSLKLSVVTAAMLAVVALSGVAHAGIFTYVTASADPGAIAVPGLNDGDGSAFVSVTATTSDSPVVDISGTTLGDPTMFLDEAIKNNSGVAWDQYTVTINPGPGSNVSNIQVFTPAHFPNWLPSTAITSNSVTYFGGFVTPANTMEVNISFDVSDDNGTFSYTIGNTPSAVPEPASLALLGLGGALLLRRKKHV